MTNNDKMIRIMDAVTKCSGITLEMMQSRKRTAASSLARGVFYLVARDEKIPCREAAVFAARSRPSCILVTQKYMGYLYIKDKITVSLYEKVRNILKTL